MWTVLSTIEYTSGRDYFILQLGTSPFKRASRTPPTLPMRVKLDGGPQPEFGKSRQSVKTLRARPEAAERPPEGSLLCNIESSTIKQSLVEEYSIVDNTVPLLFVLLCFLFVFLFLFLLFCCFVLFLCSLFKPW